MLISIPEAARRALRAMDPAKYEYQSDFAKQYIAVGRAEGLAEGQAKSKVEGKMEIVLKLLALRFGSLSEAVQTEIRRFDESQLDKLVERIVRAATLEEAMGEI